jgi:hypothetical protein
MQTKNQVLSRHKKQLRTMQIVISMAFVTLLFLLAAVFANPAGVLAQGGPKTETKYMTVRTFPLENGKSIDEVIIHGPSKPPAGYEAERASVIIPNPSAAAKTLTVPAYNWVFGCSAVSGSMIAAYYDRAGYPNMYTGPTDGGVMPLDNSVWGTWSDGVDTYPNIPLAASRNGVDGRSTRGSIDDYWVRYESAAKDPFIAKGWVEHAWGDAIGDYMKTSQSKYNNRDGSTSFYTWTSDPGPLTCADMVVNKIHTRDGTYGRKLFYEARGYTVADCYSRKTSNTIAGGFSFANYKAQIDAGRPVMINLAGHTVVGVGYNDPNTVYLHDTWDYSTHSMKWGGSYAGMQMQSVSIVNPASSSGGGFNSQFNGSAAGWAGVKGAWTNYASMYYRSAGLANKVASAKHANNYKNFAYVVRMKRSGACVSCANHIVIRGKPASLALDFNWQPSYVFQYNNKGQFSVWKISSAGGKTALKAWTSSAHIVKNGWNTLKVIANGASLKFYINNKLVWSGSDLTLTTGQVGFGFRRDGRAGSLDVDWARLSMLGAEALPFDEADGQGMELPADAADATP